MGPSRYLGTYIGVPADAIFHMHLLHGQPSLLYPSISNVILISVIIESSLALLDKVILLFVSSIPFIIEEIHRLSTIYHQSILGHNNRLAVEISNPPTVRRRLKRQWPSDLPQPSDDKN
jgi:hypothetical protein